MILVRHKRALRGQHNNIILLDTIGTLLYAPERKQCPLEECSAEICTHLYNENDVGFYRFVCVHARSRASNTMTTSRFLRCQPNGPRENNGETKPTARQQWLEFNSSVRTTKVPKLTSDGSQSSRKHAQGVRNQRAIKKKSSDQRRKTAGNRKFEKKKKSHIPTHSSRTGWRGVCVVRADAMYFFYALLELKCDTIMRSMLARTVHHSIHSAHLFRPTSTVSSYFLAK